MMTAYPYCFSIYPRFLAALLCLGLWSCGDDSSYGHSENTSSQINHDNGPDSTNSTTESGNVSREYVDSTPVKMQGHNFNPPPMRVSPGGKDLAQRRAAQVQNVLSASRKYGIEPYMIHAIITVESSYKPHAQSEVGAAGLMQLMPYTGERFGCGGNNRFQSACNVDAGTAYLKFLSKRFGGNLQAVAAAYNAGEGTVESYLYGKPMKGKNPTGIKTPNGVPLASFGYSSKQKARGCPPNNWNPTEECQGQTYAYARKVAGYYLLYRNNPQLIGLNSNEISHEGSDCQAREIC